MSISTVQGVVPRQIYQNSTGDNTTHYIQLDFGSTQVTWAGATYVPEQFNDTLDNVIAFLKNAQNTSVLSYYFSYQFIITGTQTNKTCIGTCTPSTDIVFCPGTCNPSIYNDKTINDHQQFRFAVGSNSTYNVNATSNQTNVVFDGTDFSQTYPGYAAVYAHSVCSGGDCSSNGPQNYSLSINLLLNVNFSCPASNIDNYLCQNFIKDEIYANGPNTSYDDVLNQYCLKYTGMEDLLTNGSATDQDLCGCHLDLSQYTNYRDSLAPSYSAAGIALGQLNDQCLFPQCASSSFPSVNRGAKCNVPLCLNVVSINSDGSINLRGASISQSAECSNFKPVVPPSNRNKIIIIVVIIVIVIILLVGGYFLFTK